MATARELVRRWTRPTVEDLLGTSAPIPTAWRITTKEFRGDIEWLVVLDADTPQSSAVAELIAELTARSVSTQTG